MQARTILRRNGWAGLSTKYNVRIRPIAMNIVILKGPFSSEEEAWEWAEQNNNPLVDYDVLAVEEEQDDVPPWDE